MAYTSTFTKESVTKKTDVISTISVNVSISDGTSVVFEKAYSKDYNSNTTDLTDFKNSMLAEIQKDWDKYLAEKFIFDSQEFDQAVTDMQTTANAYLNS